jgi:hypothetical protein
MSEPIDLEGAVGCYDKALVDKRDYQLSAIKDSVAALQRDCDVLLGLPTGTGKTIIFLPIATAAVRKGLRTAILTSTKSAQLRISKFLSRFDGLQADLVFGEAEYACPLLDPSGGRKAESWCCKEYKEAHCRPNNLGCGVIKSEQILDSSDFLITNFAKFLTTRKSTTFDIIVLDDSHSFESAKEQAMQVTMFFGPLRFLYERMTNGETLKDELGRFLTLFAEVFGRTLPPSEMDASVPVEYIKRFRTEVFLEEDDQALRKQIAGLPTDRQEAFWSIFYFVQRCKRSSVNEFYIRRDFYKKDDYDGAEMSAKPTDEQIASLVKRKFGNARVMFASATPGNPIGHAYACTLRDYREQRKLVLIPDGLSLPAPLANWFEKLKIYIADDLGDTRQDPAFDSAMGIVSEILSGVQQRSLILFKNYRDQKNARRILGQKFREDQLLFIDNTQSREQVEDVAQSKLISLASASSTVWEGINIQSLRMSIIVTPPYIRPPPGEDDYVDLQRRMIIRLEQGIGRIIRDPSDYGVAVLLDQRFQKIVRNATVNKYLTGRVQGVPSDRLRDLISEDFASWSEKR